jgi:hypothetical protein
MSISDEYFASGFSIVAKEGNFGLFIFYKSPILFLFLAILIEKFLSESLFHKFLFVLSCFYFYLSIYSYLYLFSCNRAFCWA